MARVAALLAVLAVLVAPAVAVEPAPTFRIDYVVRIDAEDPGRAHVRWQLAGIDEIAYFELVFRDDRFREVRGSGTLAWQGRRVRWTPASPYAHLAYTVTIDHPRPPGAGWFDGYATPQWVVTRAQHLFPQINVEFRAHGARATSAARLLFELPPGWRSASAHAPLGEHRYAVEEPGKQLDRPRGWFALGRFTERQRTIAGALVRVALVPGSPLDGSALLELYDRTMPLLAGLLGPPPPQLLVVSAPDPMWAGGLSGEASLYVNGHIPLRSHDRTSTYLHELFHVWFPLRTGPDGRWISEGLAEYCSLVLQHRAGRLSADGFARGVSSFARTGRFGVDLSRTDDPSALNNSAPLVMFWIDREIARATAGRRTLDDAVRELVRDGGPLTTAAFLRVVNRIAGRNLTPLFRRYVYRGVAPPIAGVALGLPVRGGVS